MCNELGHLSQGFNDFKGNITLCFIPKYKVPRIKKVTQKTETYRVQVIAGEKIVNYKGDPSTPVCSTEKTRCTRIMCHPNQEKKHCIADLKDLFLMETLEEHNYLSNHVSLMHAAFFKTT